MHRCARVWRSSRECRYHRVGESEVYKEERDVLEEQMREMDESDRRSLVH